MTMNKKRSAGAEFWIFLALTVLVVGGLVLFLWQPWDRKGIASNRTLVFHCAAGMSKPVRDIIEEYKDTYGVEVQVNFGGTGKLLSTMEATVVNDDPTTVKGDLYLAADRFHMEKAQAEGLVAEAIPVAYLRPVLVINKKTQERLQSDDNPVAGIKDLLRKDLKVVLANPELAAVGKLAKEGLIKTGTGIWPKLEKELKQASNRVSTVGTVNEVIAAVRTSDDTLGVVWKANARQQPTLAVIEPEEFKNLKELVQVGVCTSAKGEQATAALQFARFLSARDKGLKAFAANQFQPIPNADLWAERPKIHLSAGAMLKPGIDDVVKSFAKREGVEIDTSYNGCGILVAQMESIKKGDKPGQFPDAYFSCDVSFMKDVEQWFGAAKTISENDMVMIVQKNNPKNIKSLNDLTRKNLKIGLGHPKNSALGKLTEDLLKSLDEIYDQIYTEGWQEAGRVVHADAGHDLVNKVRVGALDVAVVYRSNAKANPENIQKHMDIVNLNVPGALARQPFAIAKDSPHRQMMTRLLRAIVAQQTANRFETLGFKWVYANKSHESAN